MYPLSEWARPVGSFNVPVPVVTQNPMSDPTVQVRFNSQWLPYILGALLQLGEQSTWQTEDREELLLIRQWVWQLMDQFANWENYEDYAPYWDDADGEDAEGTPADSEFSFLENVSDWIVTAFLAASFSPVAAVEFVTIARRFRLAFRTRDYGRIVRVFLDGIFQMEVDTYSAEPGVLYQDIFTPATFSGFSAFDVDEFILRVEATADANPLATPTADGYGMEVIRKRLYEGEVSPTNERYSEDCDCIQETFDDGETWVDRPLSDPRKAPQFLKPIVDAADPRCKAAANAREWLETFIEEVLYMMGVASTVEGLVALMITLFLVLGPWAILVDVVLVIAFLMFDAGVSVVNGAFTVAVFNALECIIYCAMDDDGRVDAAALAEINTQVDAEIGGVGAAILHAIFFAMGEVGLSNAGTIGDASADCSGCECCDPDCEVMSFLASANGFTNHTWSVDYFGGVWQSGSSPFPAGWAAATASGSNRIGIKRDCGCVIANRFRVKGYRASGANGNLSVRLSDCTTNTQYCVRTLTFSSGSGSFDTGYETFTSGLGCNAEDVRIEFGWKGAAGIGFVVTEIELYLAP